MGFPNKSTLAFIAKRGYLLSMSFFLALGASLLLLAGIVYLAISKKSSFRMRAAAFVALAVMVLTVIASAIMVLMSSRKTVVVREATGFPDIPPDAIQVTPEQSNNVFLVFIILLVIMLLLVILLMVRERRRNRKQER